MDLVSYPARAEGLGKYDKQKYEVVLKVKLHFCRNKNLFKSLIYEVYLKIFKIEAVFTKTEMINE